MKGITHTRRQMLVRERKRLDDLVASNIIFLVTLVSGLPGIDRLGHRLKAVIERLAAKYDLDSRDGTLHDLHAFIIAKWNVVAPEGGMVPLIGKRVVAVDATHEVVAGGNREALFVELLSKALIEEKA